MTNKSSKLLLKVGLVLNVILIACTIAAYLSPFVDPSSVALFAVFGLVYSLILFSNFIFILFWLFIKPKFALLSVFIILVGIKNINHVYGFANSDQMMNVSNLEMGSLNLQFLKQIDLAEPQTKLSLIEDLELFVKENKHIEILCFQEFGNLPKALMDSILPYPYRHRVENMTVAIFSKYPILKSGVVDFNSNSANTCIWADIETDNGSVRVYTFHLESNRHDGKMPIKIVQNAPEKINLKVLLGIVLHYNTFTKQRSEQAKLIRKHAENSKHPIIICGDMNDSPLSHTYKSLSNEMNDAFLSSGKGLAGTHDHIKSGLRIDYIFTDKSIGPLDFKVQEVSFSDHHFLQCVLNFD